MTEKKRVYETDVMALPPLRLVLGEVPSPDPDGRHEKKQQPILKQDPETVRRLIAHLKKGEK